MTYRLRGEKNIDDSENIDSKLQNWVGCLVSQVPVCLSDFGLCCIVLTFPALSWNRSSKPRLMFAPFFFQVLVDILEF